jgi:hypothetical protein
VIRKLYFGLLLVCFTLSSAACNLVITPPPTVPELNPNGVIFTPEQTTAAIDAIGERVEDAWTPSAEDVAKLEAELPAYLQTAENPWLRADPPIWEREPEYMRQYLGIVEDGEEIIYANFFCTINDMDWHSEFVFVMDGGDCFFQVKFNPESGEFFELYVNGES